MGCKFANANLSGELLDDVPDQLFRHSFAPDPASAADPAKKTPHGNSGGRCPSIQQFVHPIRNRNSSNVTSLSPQVYDSPVAFALLKVAEGQLGEFVATKAAGKQQSQQCTIAFALDLSTVWSLPECLRLFGG